MDKYRYLHEPRVDFLGNEINVGDEVVCLSPYYRDLVKATIIKMTPKQIKVKLMGNYNSTTTRYPNQVVKVVVESKPEEEQPTEEY